MRPESGLSRRQLLLAAGRFALAGGLGVQAMPLLAEVSHAERLQSFIDGLVARREVPGAVVALGEGDSAPRFLRSGTLAFDSAAAVNEDTLWRIYSQTKPVTGIAAMLLIGEGRLRLDQPLAEVIPEFGSPRVLSDPEHSLAARPAAHRITIRHLLTHTAGLGYTTELNTGPLADEYRRLGLVAGRYNRDDAATPGRAPTVPSLREFSERVAGLPLIAEPGARWSYSCSLDVLARVIEIVAGMPFDAFLQQRLFTPLGMRHTGFRVPAADGGRLATNYRVVDAKIETLDPGASSVYLDPPPFPFGGSGLVSSARDYDRFLAMLANRGTLDGVTVLSPDTALLAMSNLLPEGVDLSMLERIGMGGAGFGAGGSVALSGPARGMFGWGGLAGTDARVNPFTGRRASAYINVIGRYVFLPRLVEALD